MGIIIYKLFGSTLNPKRRDFGRRLRYKLSVTYTGNRTSFLHFARVPEIRSNRPIARGPVTRIFARTLTPQHSTELEVQEQQSLLPFY